MRRNSFRSFRATGALNVKLLIIVAGVAALLVVGAFVTREIRRSQYAQRMLNEGTAAYKAAQWEAAAVALGRYLAMKPDDRDALRLFAEACLKVRPMTTRALGQATTAYRQVWRHESSDAEIFRRLLLLYEAGGNTNELETVAQRWLEEHPQDPLAELAVARSQALRRRPAEARATLQQIVERHEKVEGPRRPEVVEACLLLSTLAPEENIAGAREWTQQWLNRAVEYDPESALARAQRASVMREWAGQGAGSQGEALLAAVRDDLAAVERAERQDPRAVVLAAEEYTALGDFQRAQALLEVAHGLPDDVVQQVLIDPSDWVRLRFELEAKLLVLMGAGDEGAALAKQVLAELADRPQRFGLLPVAVELYLGVGWMEDAKVALAQFRDAVRLRGATTSFEEQLAYLDALVARAQQEPYEVIRLLEPLVARQGSRPVLRALLAEAFERTGQANRFLDTLASGGLQDVMSPDLRKVAARASLSMGRTADARAALRPMRDLGTMDIEGQLLWAGLELAEATTDAQVTAVLTTLDGLVAQSPERADARLLRSATLQQLGRSAEAEAELRTAIESSDNPLAARLALARLLSPGRSTEAERVLREACTAAPKEPAAWLALAEYQRRGGDVFGARATLEEALSVLSVEAARRTVRLRLAGIEMGAGAAEQAVARLREMADEDSSDIEVRALLLVRPDLADAEAARLLEEIRAVEGERGIVWRFHTARLALNRAGWRENFRPIEEHLQYCLQTDPRWLAPLLLLGGAYEELGDWNRAEQTYRASDSTEALDRVLGLLRRQNRFDEARQLLAQMDQRLNERAQAERRVAIALGQGATDEAIRQLETASQGDGAAPQNLIRLAALRFGRDRDVDAALALLQRAADAGGDPLLIVDFRANILGAAGRVDEAEQVLNTLVADQPSAEAHFLRASFLLRSGKVDAAEADYRAVAELAGNDGGPAMLGEFFAQTDRLDAAIAAWDEGLQKFPDSVTLRRGLAKALLTRANPGDGERAAQLAARLVADAPDETENLWVQAVLLDQAGDRAGLEVVLARAVRGAPAQAAAYIGLARVALASGLGSQARALVARGLQLYPNQLELRVQQAEVEFALQEFATARNLAEQALADAGRNERALTIVLAAAEQQKDRAALVQGLEMLQTWIGEQPDAVSLRLLRARVRAALGEHEAAAAELAAYAVPAGDGQSIDVLLMLADLYRLAGQAPAAAAQLDAAERLAPGDRRVLELRMQVLVADQQFDAVAALADERERSPVELMVIADGLSLSPAHANQALTLCERALVLDANYAPAHARIGELRYRQGDLKGAAEAFRALLKLDPGQLDAQNNLAWMLAESGENVAEAVELAQRATDARPGDANFRDTLAFTLRRAGRLEDARREYARSLDTAPPGAARARTLLHLAEVCGELNDWRGLRPFVGEAEQLAGEAGAEYLSPEERALLGRAVSQAR